MSYDVALLCSFVDNYPSVLEETNKTYVTYHTSHATSLDQSAQIVYRNYATHPPPTILSRR